MVTCELCPELYDHSVHTQTHRNAATCSSVSLAQALYTPAGTPPEQNPNWVVISFKLQPFSMMLQSQTGWPTPF